MLLLQEKEILRKRFQINIKKKLEEEKSIEEVKQA